MTILYMNMDGVEEKSGEKISVLKELLHGTTMLGFNDLQHHSHNHRWAWTKCYRSTEMYSHGKIFDGFVTETLQK